MTAMTKPIQNRSVVDQPKVKQPNIRTVSPVHHLHSANLCECYIRSLQSPRRSQPWQLSPRALRLLWPYRAARPTSQCKGCSEIASGIQKSAISSKGELLLWTPILISIRQYLNFFGGSLNMFQQPATLSPPAACMSCWSWEWSWRKCKRSSWDAPKIPPNLVCFSWPMILVINDMQPATHVLQICGNIQNIPLPPLGWAQLAVSLLPPQRLLPEASMMWLWRTSTEAQTT